MFHTEKKEFYTLISANFLKERKKSTLFDEFNKIYTNFKQENIILNLLEVEKPDLDEIMLFSPLSLAHKKNGKSFVMVLKEGFTDDLPDEMITVPTLTEAEDVVNLEEIERDLGI